LEKIKKLKCEQSFTVVIIDNESDKNGHLKKYILNFLKEDHLNISINFIEIQNISDANKYFGDKKSNTDLLLIDINLKEQRRKNENVLNLLDKIKNLKQAFPIIAITNKKNDKIINEVKKHGVIHCIKKDTIDRQAKNPNIDIFHTLLNLAINAFNQLCLKERAIKEMEIMAKIDFLTSFYNKGSLSNLYEENMKEEIGCIIWIDIDKFKTINDTFGHQTGDEIIKNISRSVEKSVRHDDFCIRFGGDEFIILLPNTKSSEAQIVSERIRNEVKNTKNQENITATASIGITETKVSENQVDVIARADKALYKAKENGRDQVVVF
jgi:two-component system, cell cycle response regulator